MKREITVTKEIEFDLDEPRFISLYDSIFIEFIPGDQITVKRFSLKVDEPGFSLDVRHAFDNELEYLFETDAGTGDFKEITRDEFYSVIKEVLLQYYFIEENITS
jgi:hypothetical protein